MRRAAKINSIYFLSLSLSSHRPRGGYTPTREEWRGGITPLATTGRDYELRSRGPASLGTYALDNLVSRVMQSSSSTTSVHQPSPSPSFATLTMGDQPTLANVMKELMDLSTEMTAMKADMAGMKEKVESSASGGGCIESQRDPDPPSSKSLTFLDMMARLIQCCSSTNASRTSSNSAPRTRSAFGWRLTTWKTLPNIGTYNLWKMRARLLGVLQGTPKFKVWSNPSISALVRISGMSHARVRWRITPTVSKPYSRVLAISMKPSGFNSSLVASFRH
jgi:hypothetical protein